MKIRISLGQFDIQLGAPQENLARVSTLAAQANQRESQFLLLPELWSTGYDLENWPMHAAPLEQGFFAEMAGLARAHRLWLGGSLLERRGSQAYNTFVLYDSLGELAACYRKIHRFRLMDEDQWLGAGDRPVLASLKLTEDAPTLKAGLAVCYDLRFPELFRSYALQGAELILLPAEWPAARLEHWQVLLRARAIENQCFIAAVNRVGVSKGEAFGGHSQVIDPWGRVLLQGGTEPELLTVDLDLGEAARVRRQIPILEDRQPDAYELK